MACQYASLRVGVHFYKKIIIFYQTNGIKTKDTSEGVPF